MNRKQLSLLLFLAVVLGVAGLVVYRKQTASFQAGGMTIGKKLLGDLPINDITRIAVKHGTNELNLIKKADLWRVQERNDYPSNFGQLSEFLLKAAELKMSQIEKVGPSQLPRFGLATAPGSNAATIVEFHGAGDKLIKTLLLGKNHLRKSKGGPSPYGEEMPDTGYPDGRYVKVGADSPDVAVISDTLSTIEPRPDQWINKDFIKVEKVRSIAVTFPTATNSWKLSRETESGEWKLADARTGEQIDSSKTSSLATALNSPTISDVDTASKPEQLGLNKPTLVVLDTFDNFTYTIKVGVKTNDNYPVLVAVSAQLPKERTPGKDEKPEDKTRLDKDFNDSQKKLTDKLAQEQACEKWTYLVSSWTLDNLLKDRSQLLQEKKEEPKKDEKAVSAATPDSSPSPSPTPPTPTPDSPAQK
jgi:hypothetical protein